MTYIDLYLFAVEYYIVNKIFLTQNNIFSFFSFLRIIKERKYYTI